MNIYISNLSYRVVDSDLRHLFEKFGKVSSAKVIFDHQAGHSKGFGFIDMPDKDESSKAIAKLNQTEYDGKLISVFEARPRDERTYSKTPYSATSDRRRHKTTTTVVDAEQGKRHEEEQQ